MKSRACAPFHAPRAFHHTEVWVVGLESEEERLKVGEETLLTHEWAVMGDTPRFRMEGDHSYHFTHAVRRDPIGFKLSGLRLQHTGTQL